MSFTEKEKADFHRKWIVRLKKLAKILGMEPGTFDVRSNKGGPAVLGEVTLHGEKIYIQASHYEWGALVRSCKGRKDYTGGRNQYVSLPAIVELIEDPERINSIQTLEHLKKIQES